MHLLCLTLCLIHTVALTAASFSGLYVDNGLDQTILQRVLSTREQRNVQEQLLNLLGLPEPPKSRSSSKQASSVVAAPKFLLDAYKSTLDSTSGRQTRSELELSEQDLQAIEESDMIMSFVSKGKHPNTANHDQGKLLWFDVSEFPLAGSLVSAELRIYQAFNSSLRNDGSALTASLYSISNIDDGVLQMSLVDSVNTTSDKEGWLIFNATAPLNSWNAFPESNRGFYVSVQSASSEHNSVLPDEIGLITNQENEDVSVRPFMVAFLRGQSDVRHRVTRQARHRRKKERPDFSEGPPRRFSDQSLLWSQPQKSCQIQTLYVSFKDLKWQDWIIAPDGYGAFYCSGECNFPLNAHMNATNHAIVQTLVHLMKPNIVPKPCCAPTKLTPISVLYFVDDSNVMLKKYKNMVVKSCGCH